jgi:tape measure domain-containing protein
MSDNNQIIIEFDGDTTQFNKKFDAVRKRLERLRDKEHTATINLEFKGRQTLTNVKNEVKKLESETHTINVDIQIPHLNNITSLQNQFANIASTVNSFKVDDSIVRSLTGVTSALQGITNFDATSLRDTRNAISDISSSLQNLKNLNTAPVNNIQNVLTNLSVALRGVNRTGSTGIRDLASSLSTLSSALQAVTRIDATYIQDLANSVSSLHIDPALADQMKTLGSAMSRLGKGLDDLSLTKRFSAVNNTVDLINDLGRIRVTGDFSGLEHVSKIVSGIGRGLTQLEKINNVNLTPVKVLINMLNSAHVDISSAAGFEAIGTGLGKIVTALNRLDSVTVNSMSNLQRMLGVLGTFIQQLTALGNNTKAITTVAELIRELKNLTTALGGTQSGMRRVQTSTQQTTSSLSVFSRQVVSNIADLRRVAASIYIFKNATTWIKQTSEELDRYTVVQNKLRGLYDGDENKVSKVSEMIFQSAQDARTSMEAFSTTFLKVQLATEKYGFSAQQAVQVTNTLAKAMVIGGATASETASVMLQFSQALSKGKLDGDEFRSVMENSPVLMRALAREAGKAMGVMNAGQKELMKWSKEGKLTIDILIKALLNLHNEIDEKFSNTTETVGQAFQKLENVSIKTMGQFASETGLLDGVKNVVNGIGNLVKLLNGGLGKTVISLGKAVLFLGQIYVYYKALRGVEWILGILSSARGSLVNMVGLQYSLVRLNRENVALRTEDNILTARIAMADKAREAIDQRILMIQRQINLNAQAYTREQMKQLQNDLDHAKALRDNMGVQGTVMSASDTGKSGIGAFVKGFFGLFAKVAVISAAMYGIQKLTDALMSMSQAGQTLKHALEGDISAIKDLQDEDLQSWLNFADILGRISGIDFGNVQQLKQEMIKARNEVAGIDPQTSAAMAKDERGFWTKWWEETKRGASDLTKSITTSFDRPLEAIDSKFKAFRNLTLATVQVNDRVLEIVSEKVSALGENEKLRISENKELISLVNGSKDLVGRLAIAYEHMGEVHLANKSYDLVEKLNLILKQDALTKQDLNAITRLMSENVELIQAYNNGSEVVRNTAGYTRADGTTVTLLHEHEYRQQLLKEMQDEVIKAKERSQKLNELTEAYPVLKDATFDVKSELVDTVKFVQELNGGFEKNVGLLDSFAKSLADIIKVQQGLEGYVNPYELAKKQAFSTESDTMKRYAETGNQYLKSKTGSKGFGVFSEGNKLYFGKSADDENRIPVKTRDYNEHTITTALDNAQNAYERAEKERKEKTKSKPKATGGGGHKKEFKIDWLDMRDLGGNLYDSLNPENILDTFTNMVGANKNLLFLNEEMTAWYEEQAKLLEEAKECGVVLSQQDLSRLQSLFMQRRHMEEVAKAEQGFVSDVTKEAHQREINIEALNDLIKKQEALGKSAQAYKELLTEQRTELEKMTHEFEKQLKLKQQGDFIGGITSRYEDLYKALRQDKSDKEITDKEKDQLLNQAVRERFTEVFTDKYNEIIGNGKGMFGYEDIINNIAAGQAWASGNISDYGMAENMRGGLDTIREYLGQFGRTGQSDSFLRSMGLNPEEWDEWSLAGLNAIAQLTDGFKGLTYTLSEELSGAMTKFTDGIANGLANAIVKGEDLKSTLHSLAQTILVDLISALIKMGIQYVATKFLMATVDKGMQAQEAVASVAHAKVVAAAWLPAATLVSTATEGEAPITGKIMMDLMYELNKIKYLGAGFAEGGYTGVGGKYQPAGIVHKGEYVFTQADVDRIGLTNLESLHNGEYNITNNNVSNYNSQAGVGGNNVSIVNVVDPAMVKAYLNTSDGQQVILNTIKQNPKAVKQIVATA